MKVLYFLFLLVASLVLKGQASSGGPDNFGYTYKSSLDSSGPTYQWLDLTGKATIVTGLADDNFVGPFSISGFPYYSSNPTQLYIGSNGYISFNPVNIASTNAQFPAIPTVGGPNDFIAPMLTDLNFAGNSSNPGLVYYYNQGDTICVSYEKVPFWYGNANQYFGDNSFQVILNKRDSSITFNYKTQIGTPDPNYTINVVSIGIENGSGNDGLQYLRADTFPNPNTSIRFEYPTIVQPVTDVNINYISNSDNSAEFLANNSLYVPKTSVKNSGNQDVLSPITVTTKITDPAGIAIFNQSQTIDSLKAGDDSLVVFPTFNPLNPGKYVVETYISQVTNDNTLSNDTNSSFFKVIDTNMVPQTLDYTDGMAGLGIGWSGGNGGCGIYIEPPYYPAVIQASNFFITTKGTPGVGFHSVIYDDSGRKPGDGVVLDSTFVPPSSFSIGQYVRVPTTSNVTITQGGVYLLWLMDGDGINLARSFVQPSSKQTYEIIGGAWSSYRDISTQDFLMNLEIAPMNVAVGLDEESDSNDVMTAFPVPSSSMVTVQLGGKVGNKTIQVLDVNGKPMQVKILRYDNSLRIIRGNLPAGTYFVRVGKSIRKIVFTD